jgi:ABC-type nickel/cobalt efflux system permease component RcnA
VAVFHVAPGHADQLLAAFWTVSRSAIASSVVLRRVVSKTSSFIAIAIAIAIAYRLSLDLMARHDSRCNLAVASSLRIMGFISGLVGRLYVATPLIR